MDKTTHLFATICSRLASAVAVAAVASRSAAAVRTHNRRWILWWEAPRGSVHFGVLPITHRIHVCYIWQHGSHQYTPNVSIYTSTMDPMNPMGFIQPSFHGGLPRISVVVIIPQLTTQSNMSKPWDKHGRSKHPNGTLGR